MSAQDNDEMEIYVFASSSITNIWAGFGARKWAVAKPSDPGTQTSQRTKASKIRPGMFGLLYCTPWKSFTVPFVFRSRPDPEVVEKQIWHSEWILPFEIVPLGSPILSISGERIKSLSGAIRRGKTNYSHYLHVQGNFVFQPSRIDSDDWVEILSELT